VTTSTDVYPPAFFWDVPEEETHFDPVSHVEHYQFLGELETIHVITRAIELNGLSGAEAYHYGNVLKYLLRCGRKENKVQDLKKAQTYLGFMLDEQTP